VNKMNEVKKDALNLELEILKFIGQDMEWDSSEVLFNTVAHFFQRLATVHNFLVISSPIDDAGLKNRDHQDYFRILWDFDFKKRKTKIAQKKLLDFSIFLDEIRSQKKVETKTTQQGHIREFYNEEDKSWGYSFILGVSKKQVYRLMFSTLNSFFSHSASFEYLCLFISKVFSQTIKYSRLIEMNSLIYIDDVTGLFNQRKLMVDLDYHIQRSIEEESTFSVFFIDVDHFKLINDGHGHIVGSKVLREFSQVFQANFRDTDLIYRYGGDEFVLVIPDVNFKDAKILGDRLLGNILKHHFLSDEGLNLTIGVSIGIALYPNDASTKKDILQMADAMMYQAKKEGRGRVCSAKEILNG